MHDADWLSSAEILDFHGVCIFYSYEKARLNNDGIHNESITSKLLPNVKCSNFFMEAGIIQAIGYGKEVRISYDTWTDKRPELAKQELENRLKQMRRLIPKDNFGRVGFK